MDSEAVEITPVITAKCGDGVQSPPPHHPGFARVWSRRVSAPCYGARSHSVRTEHLASVVNSRRRPTPGGVAGYREGTPALRAGLSPLNSRSIRCSCPRGNHSRPGSVALRAPGPLDSRLASAVPGPTHGCSPADAFGQEVPEEVSFHPVPPAGAMVAGDAGARRLADVVRAMSQEGQDGAGALMLARPAQG